MADPTTGATYEVPALKAEDKDTVRYVPDMSALDTQADIDTQIDRIIEGQEDIDQAASRILPMILTKWVSWKMCSRKPTPNRKPFLTG